MILNFQLRDKNVFANTNSITLSDLLPANTSQDYYITLPNGGGEVKATLTRGAGEGNATSSIDFMSFVNQDRLIEGVYSIKKNNEVKFFTLKTPKEKLKPSDFISINANPELESGQFSFIKNDDKINEIKKSIQASSFSFRTNSNNFSYQISKNVDTPISFNSDLLVTEKYDKLTKNNKVKLFIKSSNNVSFLLNSDEGVSVNLNISTDDYVEEVVFTHYFGQNFRVIDNLLKQLKSFNIRPLDDSFLNIALKKIVEKSTKVKDAIYSKDFRLADDLTLQCVSIAKEYNNSISNVFDLSGNPYPVSPYFNYQIQIDELKQTLTSIIGQVSALNDRVKAIELSISETNLFLNQVLILLQEVNDIQDFTLANLAEISERVGDLSDSLINSNALISNLEQRVSSLESEILAIESLENITQQQQVLIDELSGQIIVINNVISDLSLLTEFVIDTNNLLQQNLVNQQSQLDDIQDEFTSLEVSVIQNISDIEGLQTDLLSLQNQISSLQNSEKKLIVNLPTEIGITAESLSPDIFTDTTNQSFSIAKNAPLNTNKNASYLFTGLDLSNSKFSVSSTCNVDSLTRRGDTIFNYSTQNVPASNFFGSGIELSSNLQGNLMGSKVYGNFIYLFGRIDSYNGDATGNLIKVSLIDGTLDNSFTPSFNGMVRDIEIDAGEIELYVVGDFTTCNAFDARRIAKILILDGSNSTDWNQFGASKAFDSFAGSMGIKRIGDDGLIYIRHGALNYDGTSVGALFAINKYGDIVVNSSITRFISNFDYDSVNGRIIATGNFSLSEGGRTYNFIYAFRLDLTVDTSFIDGGFSQVPSSGIFADFNDIKIIPSKNLIVLHGQADRYRGEYVGFGGLIFLTLDGDFISAPFNNLIFNTEVAVGMGSLLVNPDDDRTLYFSLNRMLFNNVLYRGVYAYNLNSGFTQNDLITGFFAKGIPTFSNISGKSLAFYNGELILSGGFNLLTEAPSKNIVKYNPDNGDIAGNTPSSSSALITMSNISDVDCESYTVDISVI